MPGPVRAVRDDLLPIAARIREATKVIGTQVAAAKAAGVSPRQVRSYVSARSKPDADVLVRLADAAGFTLEWLVTGEGPKRRDEAAQLEAPFSEPVREEHLAVAERLREVVKRCGTHPHGAGARARDEAARAFRLLPGAAMTRLRKDAKCEIVPKVGKDFDDAIVAQHRELLEAKRAERAPARPWPALPAKVEGVRVRPVGRPTVAGTAEVHQKAVLAKLEELRAIVADYDLSAPSWPHAGPLYETDRLVGLALAFLKGLDGR